MLADEDRRGYEIYLDILSEQFEDGRMSEYQFRRFLTALKLVSEEQNRQYENLKKLVHKAHNPGIKLVSGGGGAGAA
jgi:hypothetical protein